MKKIVVAVVSIGILASTYAIAFGIPSWVVQLWGNAPSAEPTATPHKPNGPARGQSRSTTVVLAPLEEESYSLVLRTIGSAVSLRRTEVISTDSGEVAESKLQANKLVERGEVLLRLDDRAERLALDIAEAERDQAQATVTRYQGLRQNGTAVVTDVALSDAQVALRLAKAQVGLAQLALDDRTLVAPISGRLGLSEINTGDRLSSGDIIVTIDDTATLLATFEVPERSIGLLAEGKKVLVTTPTYAGRVFEGRITAFDSRLDSVTRSATVEAEIDNSDGLLLSGMTFTIRMNEETAPLPVVPATAITWNRSGAGIWVAEDGAARRLPVAIRYRDGDQVWIETDAPPGVQVVAEGASKLREGSQVATASSEGPGA